MSNTNTSQGRYLYSVRMRNGYENVSEYLRNYKLPISDAYYRDVEAGRKTLSLEKALELMGYLPVPKEENHEIVHCIIQDSLPQEISSKLLKPRFNLDPSNLKEIMDTLQYDTVTYEEAYELVRFKLEQTFLGTEQDIKYLDLHFDMLPILHYVYMVENASLESIISIAQQCGIKYSNEAIKEYLSHICEMKIDNGNIICSRKKRIFRVPKSDIGKNFKRRFFFDELLKSFQNSDSAPFSLNGTFETSMIQAIPISELPALKKKILSLLADLEIKSSDLDNENSEPFFFALVTSNRKQYKFHKPENNLNISEYITEPVQK